MNTPVCDFVNRYSESNSLRLHMPGHKGKSFIGFEPLDITEFDGADSLYEAKGIIAESENNASRLFGAHTFYSAEGSSLSIRAMMYLLKLWGGNPLIIAARNAHKTFISSAALLDLDVEWIYPKDNDSYLSCPIDLSELEALLSNTKDRKTAVYITSPDYLGNIADIGKISELCKKHNSLLCVDNAHGAYLKFLAESKHPIDLGADICCDSAHKTLPVITGGAYLHISENAPCMLKERAKDALALFGSTSPSYLILQSLDHANRYISEEYGEKLKSFSVEAEKAKILLSERGYTLKGNEPLKIVIDAKKYGYLGTELSRILASESMVCEFADDDNLVMMLTPENGKEALGRITDILTAIPQKEAITEKPPNLCRPERCLSLREALFAESEMHESVQSVGKIFADANIACPPAVPLIVAGERIDENVIRCFEYYQIKECRIVKKQ